MPCFTPICFIPFCFNTPYQFTPSYFQLNALWLAPFYCANPFFLSGVSLLIYAFLIYAQFLRNTTTV